MSIPFVRARHFTDTGKTGRKIDLVVIHSMEAPEKGDTAEKIAGYFSSTDRRASAHKCFDDNSVVRCVLDKDVAYAAPGANHNGLQYELAGYARQSEAEWQDGFSQRLLHRVAMQLVEDCEKYDVPLRFVDAAGLRRGDRGVTTHWQVTQAFGKSTHTDPGPAFPMVQLLALAQGESPHEEENGMELTQGNLMAIAAAVETNLRDDIKALKESNRKRSIELAAIIKKLEIEVDYS